MKKVVYSFRYRLGPGQVGREVFHIVLTYGAAILRLENEAHHANVKKALFQSVTKYVQHPLKYKFNLPVMTSTLWPSIIWIFFWRPILRACCFSWTDDSGSWTAIWRIRFPLCLNALSHSGHWCVFSCGAGGTYVGLWYRLQWRFSNCFCLKDW